MTIITSQINLLCASLHLLLVVKVLLEEKYLNHHGAQ